MLRLRRSSYLPIALLTAIASLSGESVRPVIDAVPDIFTPVPIDQQRIAGLLSGRLRANMEGFLEHVSPAALLLPFRERASDTRTDRQAQNAGLFLLAAANAYEYSDDAQLKALMDETAHGLVATQERDGYLGPYTQQARWSSGDLFAQASNLSGLFAYGRVTGDDEAFDAGHRAADRLVAELSKHSDLQTGPEAVALLPPFAELYRGTGDTRYLVFSQRLLDQQPIPLKASGATVLFGFGAVEVYRLTGAENELKKAQSAWQLIAPTVSAAGAPQLSMTQKEEEAPDTCVLYLWLQLNEDLFRITGDPKYSQAIHHMTYNQLLASQNGRTGSIDTSTALTGSKQFTHEVNACSLAEAAAITELPDVMWGRYGNGIGIVTYSPGRATLRLRRRATVQLYLESNYPESGTILLHVEPTHDTRFPLQLYVPSWTHQYWAEIAGTRQLGKPGHFLTLTREWKKGDTVKISIEMNTSVVTDPAHPELFALRRGPQLLALNRTMNPEQTRDKALKVSAAEAQQLKAMGTAPVMPLGGADAQNYVLTTEGKDGQELIFAPYADAASDRVWLTIRQ